jgi:hypothetical protein
MRKRFRLRTFAGLTGIVAAAATMMVVFAGSAGAVVAGAGFTTDDPGFTSGSITYGACTNGPAHSTPGVNCNLYQSKDDVWTNGGPSEGQNLLSDGTYFFAVLAPSGQANPNDGSTDLLSSDAYTEREFTISGGKISTYLGATHVTDNQYSGTLGLLINLMPYADTPNPGGVYIMAMCQIDPANYDPTNSPVTPSSCKYDAFKAPSSTCAGDCTPQPFGALSGEKYYDANANGTLDPGEAGIAGWQINIHDGFNQNLTTDPQGLFSIANLAPDIYTLTELQATNQRCVNEIVNGVSTPVCSPVWYQSGNVAQQWTAPVGSSVSLSSYVYSVTLGDTGTVSGLYFGNVCLGTGGGLTLGYWSNKNGQKAQFGTTTAAAATLAFLSGLNLRNANGLDFDPTTYTQFRTWLLSASATNMAYMLSAQLSAMELNVRNGNVSGSSLVYAPGVPSANSAGFITITNLMAAANAELGSNALTLSGSPYRAYQEALKTALDRANNSLNFVQATQAGCPTPTFPQGS